MKIRDDIFVSTTFTNEKTINSILLNLKKLNINNIELGSTHEYSKDIKKIVSRYDFKYLTHNFFPPRKDKMILNIASLNEHIRNKSIRHIKYCIKFSKEIGSKLYTFHPGFIGDPITESKSNNRNYDFIWKKQNKKNYYEIFETMLKSIKIIFNYAQDHKVNVAIETEGSFLNSDKILLQKPKDFIYLLNSFEKNYLKFNLNLAHLNLSSKYYKFSKKQLIDIISDDVLALEISHNNGRIDQHKPLVKNSECLNYLKKFKDKKYFKILEFRNCNYSDLIKSIKMINKI